MLEKHEIEIDKKTKIIVNSICIYTTYETSNLNEELHFLRNAKRILDVLINPVPVQKKLEKLRNAGQELENTATQKDPVILLRYALGLKEAATIMLSNNLSEKESLKIAMAKKLESLNNKINSLSKKIEQKENTERASPNTNKRKDSQNEEESSGQFSNLISKDYNKQGHKKQQKNQEKENNVQQHFTVNTPN